MRARENAVRHTPGPPHQGSHGAHGVHGGGWRPLLPLIRGWSHWSHDGTQWWDPPCGSAPAPLLYPRAHLGWKERRPPREIRRANWFHLCRTPRDTSVVVLELLIGVERRPLVRLEPTQASAIPGLFSWWCPATRPVSREPCHGCGTRERAPATLLDTWPRLPMPPSVSRSIRYLYDIYDIPCILYNLRASSRTLQCRFLFFFSWF